LLLCAASPSLLLVFWTPQASFFSVLLPPRLYIYAAGIVHRGDRGDGATDGAAMVVKIGHREDGGRERRQRGSNNSGGDHINNIAQLQLNIGLAKFMQWRGRSCGDGVVIVVCGCR